MSATALWVFAGYYLGCKIGFALTFKPHPVSVLWPPNSVLVAALLLTPPRRWWVVLLAALPADLAAQLQSHVPPLMILRWFISNSCEAIIGAGLMRYLAGGPIRFTTLRNVGLFCLCVVFIGPFLSSFLDAAFVVWNYWGQDGYWELIRIRLFSCARGINNRAVDRNVCDDWNFGVLRTARTLPLSGSRFSFSWSVGGSVTLFSMSLERASDLALSCFFLCHFSFGRRYDSARWGQALPFRLSAFWRFGVHPTGMGHLWAKRLNKARFQF